MSWRVGHGSQKTVRRLDRLGLKGRQSPTGSSHNSQYLFKILLSTEQDSGLDFCFYHLFVGPYIVAGRLSIENLGTC